MDLPLAIPPWTKLGSKIESMCRKAFFEFDLLEREEKVMVALSGGKDSLTLLYMLKAISGRGFPPLDIRAVHVGGEFSCGASLGEIFLKPICNALEIPLTIRHSTKTRENLECYSCSRERRKLIFDAAKEAGFKTVAFGHHRDDNIETLLMNLLHKAEFAGNLPKVPMHDFGVTIIRPLIYVSEQEIREFAKMYNFARISCQCPVGQVSNRRKIKDLIVQLEESFPNTRANLAQASLEFGSTKALIK
ncbi:MAG TPA: tRNA 2-thiocytidine biosynthesis TtcA family protein [Rhabdochlamydiaceae bacterium]|jgi:tRNA(Ile)-lysidine synthase TilS/MesJ|nr:tRNA 2-thiocytidine biosynthesis TtcA family protein [Rhabdochlamydiaceae bacterium]